MTAFRWPSPMVAAVAQSGVKFPNRSRSLDSVGAWISFWGYASTVEVTFQLDTHCLQDMAGGPLQDDAALLRAFDGNREAIERVASAAYGKRRVSFCRLDATDFHA